MTAEVPPPTAGWAEVPVPLTPGPALSGFALEVAAWIVAVAGPVYRTMGYSHSDALVVFVVGSVLSVATGRLDERRWWARLPLAACGGVVIIPARTLTAAYLVGSLVLADWGVRRRRPVPIGPAPTEAALPGLLVLAGVTASTARTATEPRAVIALLGASAAVIVVTSLLGTRFASFVVRLGRRVGEAVAVGGFFVLAIPAVLLPWIANRLTGLDPLEAGAAAGTNWLPRSVRDIRPADPWQPEPVERVGSTSRRVRAIGSAVLVTAACAAVLVPVTIAVRDHTRPPRPSATPSAGTAAVAGEPWYGDYLQDISWLWQTSVAWDPLAPVRLRDVTTRYVTIKDGARKTWHPPACRCRRIHVWFYGGSTVFGLGQRDLYTTASDLARVAWSHGVALDIDNRGVVGDTHWEEANRLAWDAATLPKPDLVVFLDGINDSQAVDRLTTASRQPLSFVKADFWKNYLETAGTRQMDSRWAPSSAGGGTPPPGASVPRSTPADRSSVEAVSKLIAGRYETARKVSAGVGRADAIPIGWFWQPSLEYRPDDVPGEYPMPGRAYSRQETDGALKLIGPDVHRIEHALDADRTPLYWDTYHTNERGARIVAQAMYGVLAARLRALGG